MFEGFALLSPPNAESRNPELYELFAFMATEDTPPHIANHIVIRARHCAVFKHDYVLFVRMVQRFNGSLSRQALKLFHVFVRELPN